MSTCRRFVLVTVALVCASVPARAGGGAATDAYEGIREEVPLDVHGLLDVYAQTNLVAPSSRTPVYRAFDDRLGQPALGMARLTLAHAPEVLGFRVDVGVGDVANAYLDTDPARAAHPDLSRGLSYVAQAFVTAKVSVGSSGRAIAVDVGKFGTPVGLEENESPTNWTYSRGLLFTYAEPTSHTGARATYALAEGLAVTAFWLNGWNTNVAEGNAMRSFGAAVTWNPSDQVEIVADYVGGLERAPMRLDDPALAYRSELDGYASYQLTKAVALAWTADYGHDAAQGGVAWSGVGGYLRGQMQPWLAAAIRGEELTDRDGFTTGARQRIVEVTGTLEGRRQLGPVLFIARLEYRRDQSDARVFVPSLTHQDTVVLAGMAAF